MPNTLATNLTAWLPLRGKTSPAPGEDVTEGDKRGNLARERLRGFLQLSYFFASFIRLRFSSRMRSSTVFTALRMRALGMRTASVAHG